MLRGSTLDTAFRRMTDLTADKAYKIIQITAAGGIVHIHANAHQNETLKTVWPKNARRQSLGSNTLTTII